MPRQAKNFDENILKAKSELFRKIPCANTFILHTGQYKSGIDVCRKFRTRGRRYLAVHGAADVDDLAADVRGEVAGEEEGYLGHIFRSAAATERNGLHPLLTHLF